MTLPRLVEPGSYRHVVRRCVCRRFLLRPDKETLEIFRYFFAVGAERFGVETLRLVVMSNHYHAVLFDRYGKLPAFLRWVHRMIALAMQEKWGIRGAIFEPSKSTGDQILASEEAFWKMMRYLHTNPVAAGLVKDPKQWPGLMTPAQVTALAPAKRPWWMTDKSGPQEATLQIMTPEHFITEGAEGEAPAERTARYHARLAESDRIAVEEVRAQMRHDGSAHYMGAAKAMSTSPNNSPDQAQAQAESGAPSRGTKRRGAEHGEGRKKEQRRRRRMASASPRFVAVTTIAIAAVKDKLKAFYSAYRQALAQYVRGNKDAVFPAGTWKMRQELACCTAPSRSN